MEARSKKIALGLAAAEKGQQDLSKAEERAEVVIAEARVRANEIIDQAQRRGNDTIDSGGDNSDTSSADNMDLRFKRSLGLGFLAAGVLAIGYVIAKARNVKKAADAPVPAGVVS